MDATRKVTTTASAASVAAAAGNLAHLSLLDVLEVPRPKIDTEKQKRVAVITVNVALEVRDK